MLPGHCRDPAAKGYDMDWDAAKSMEGVANLHFETRCCNPAETAPVRGPKKPTNSSQLATFARTGLAF